MLVCSIPQLQILYLSWSSQFGKVKKVTWGHVCVEYGGWHIFGMWCLTKNCCTSWAECTGVPWDKHHWRMSHDQISLKPLRKKKCPYPLLFSNRLIPNFLSPHLTLLPSPHVSLFDEGCLVCSSLCMDMHPSLKWQNHSTRVYESWFLLKSNFIISNIMDPVDLSSLQNLMCRHCYIFSDISDVMYNTNTTVH